MKNAKLRVERSARRAAAANATLGLCGGLLTLLATGVAGAQEAGGQVGMGLPGAAPAAPAPTAAATPAAGTSDHDMMTGHLAVGYFGPAALNIGATATGAPAGTVQAPVIGVRYWLSNAMGIDAGVGFGMMGGSVENNPGAGAPTVETDAPGGFALVLHGGVPLSLASSGHFSFQVVPELTVGFGSGDDGGPTDHKALLIQAGARAGGEVHFGFMGIPQLSLQASIGAFLEREGRSSENGDADTEDSMSAWQFRTASYNTPWDIFHTGVAAFYYF